MRRLLPILLIVLAAICGCKDKSITTQEGTHEASWKRFSTMKDWLAYLESEYCIHSSNLSGCMDGYDPQADDPEKFPVIMAIYDEVAGGMESDELPEQKEFCEKFWGQMKERLKEKGIDWKTPCEMNPDMKFE